MKKTITLKYGKTDKGFPFVESGKKLLQKDRHGNWNAFVDGVVKDGYKSLSDGLEAFFGVSIDTKAQFDSFLKSYPSIGREMMRETMRDFA